MKQVSIKTFVILGVGILIGIIGTLGVQKYWGYYQYNKYLEVHAYGHVAVIAKQTVETGLKGAKVLDISWSDSNADVNYVYDKLYDVTITYDLKDKVKMIEAPFGIYNGTWIGLNNTDLIVLDDTAEILYVKNP